MEKHEIEFRIYCQGWRPRGLHPVEMLERTEDGKWNEGHFVEEGGKWKLKVSKDMYPEMTEEWKRKWYKYKLKHEFSRFFFTEHHDSKVMFDSELNINEVLKIIGIK